MENPILDAFAICGHEWSQFQHEFRWELEGVLENIEMMQRLVPCLECNRLVNDEGWVHHALENHCGGRRISMGQLRIYRLTKGRECLICKLPYLNDGEMNAHIDMHLRVSTGPERTFPLKVGEGIGNLSLQERTLRLKTFLYYNFLRQRDYYLYMLIPTWLEGETVKDKLRNINKLTYIPVTISTHDTNLFTANLRTKYDMYRTLLYAPAMDENFDGVRHYRRLYGKLLLHLLASIKQQPEVMKNVKFFLFKTSVCDVFLLKYLIHVTESDIYDILKDVVENHRTVICSHDLYDDGGCVDPLCTSFVHFRVNFHLYVSASHPANQYASIRRLFDSRFGLGRFELEVNPATDKWMEFAEEIISKRRFELYRPTPYFVYTVICTRVRNSTELPSLTNIEDFCEMDNGDRLAYKAYFGLSFFSGVPPHHYNELPERNAEENDEDIELVEEDGDNTVSCTELSKAIRLGNKALFMLRNSLEESYHRAEMLEACLQLYGELSEEFDNHCPVKLINKRLELSALSLASNEVLENIIRLVDRNIPVFYQSPEDLQREPNNEEQENWGIFELPFFFNEIVALPTL